MKAAIYCRVSTEDQGKRTSLQTQYEACLKRCQEKGYQVSYQFKGMESGFTLDRLELNKLRRIIIAGEVDVIVIYCIDRLSRDPTHGVILRAEREEHHVNLESVSEDIDNSELGKMINYLYGFASKLEGEKIKERTMRGKRALLDKGILPQGTGIGIYGYNPPNKETGCRVKNEYEAKIVQKIFNMAIDGISTNQIAITLNKEGIKTKSGGLWYPLTVRRILRNQTYTGKTYYGQTKRIGKSKVEVQPKENWRLLPDFTPPIITEEMFKRAQEAMKNAKASHPVKPNGNFPLTGFMRCSECGSTIGGRTLSGKYRYYHCRGAEPTATRGKICDAKLIQADWIEALTFSTLNDFFSNPRGLLFDCIDKLYNSQNDNKNELEKQIKQINAKLSRFSKIEKDFYSLLKEEATTKDFVLDKINEIKHERQECKEQLKRLTDRLNNSLPASSFDIKFSKLIRDWNFTDITALDFQQKREILEKHKVNITGYSNRFTFHCLLRDLCNDKTSELIDADFDLKFVKSIKALETKHPKLTFIDLIDHAVPIPEDTELGKAINQAKKNNLATKSNFVTIERTSGCLISCVYEYPSGKESVDIIPKQPDVCYSI